MESSGQRASYPFANITIELDGEFYEREVVVVLTRLEEVLPGVEEPLMKHITRFEEKQTTGVTRSIAITTATRDKVISGSDLISSQKGS